jgi:hypothetical protein
MPFDKVAAGTPIKFSARKENAVVDMLNAREAGRPPNVGEAIRTDSGIILVRNESGSTLDRKAILQLSGIVSSPTGNEAGFLEHPVLSGDTPSGDYPRGCVIMLDPTTDTPGDARIGRAMVAGTTPVKVNITSTSHRYAVADDGNTTNLVSAERGPFEILWPVPASGSGLQWAVVRFPVSSAIVRRVKTDEDIADGSSGTCSVYIGTTDTTENIEVFNDWANDGDDVATGTEGWAHWDEDAQRWEWLGGGCEPA